MLVNISAIWHEYWKGFGTCAAFYEVPDEIDSREKALKLFGRIARDFAEQTDDDHAIEQIEYGFDWGIFIDCVSDEFLQGYGVKRIEIPDCMAIDVPYDDIVSDYR